jgi:hypothetical protein
MKTTMYILPSQKFQATCIAYLHFSVHYHDPYRGMGSPDFIAAYVRHTPFCNIPATHFGESMYTPFPLPHFDCPGLQILIRTRVATEILGKAALKT